MVAKQWNGCGCLLDRFLHYRKQKVVKHPDQVWRNGEKTQILYNIRLNIIVPTSRHGIWRPVAMRAYFFLWSSISNGGRQYLFRHWFRTGCGSQSDSCRLGTRVSLPGVKRPKREGMNVKFAPRNTTTLVDLSSSSTEVKNAWSCPPLLRISSCRGA
jgi:hypothetical protein